MKSGSIDKELKEETVSALKTKQRLNLYKDAARTAQ